jgi:hypothetical protein
MTAIVAIVAASLTACTSTPNATPSPRATKVAATQTNDRTYTKSDLERILNSVNTRMMLGGAVAVQDGAQAQAANSLIAALDQKDLKFAPASCGGFVLTDGQVTDKLTSENVVSAILNSSQFTMITTTIAGSALPASVVSSFGSTERASLSSCRNVLATFSVDGTSSAADVTFKRLAVADRANQSVGFREAYLLDEGGSGGTSSTTMLEAVDGNILFFVGGVGIQDVPDLEIALNTAVRAANA